MKNTKKPAFTIVGIEVRTSNNEGKATKDIPMLWNRFMEENIRNKVPNRVDDTIYAIYTDYEGDHTKPYTMLIGYKINDLDNIHEDLTVKMVEAAEYSPFIATGDLTKDAVYKTWLDIWNLDLKRAYTTDIEIYGEKATDPTNGEAEILVAVR